MRTARFLKAGGAGGRAAGPSPHHFVLLLLVVIGVVGAASAADFAVLNNGFSIRHERREVIGSVTRLYLGADAEGYVDVPTSFIERFEPDSSPSPAARSSVGLPDLINHASIRYQLDPDLVNSVIHAESGFNTRAVSSKGAQGLMQLMPQTALRLGVSDSFDPGANIEGGTRYLRTLLERYDFDLIKALAAYNAGPRRVDQYHGVPPYYETQAYVARIIRDFNRKKLAEQKAAASTRAHVKRTAWHPPLTQTTPTPESSQNAH